VATAGNTLGGAISWWMGYGAEKAYEKLAHHSPARRALAWLQRFGPKACLLSWLPVVGDPLCAVAGWLRLPFWPCVGYMAIGKFARYVTMTAALLWVFPADPWHP
jgi:membrane protein YqaA with SNARE-associated domain